MKNRPKYKKTEFSKWTNYKDLSVHPESLVDKKLLVCIKGQYQELVIRDVASVKVADFNPDDFTILVLDDKNKWHNICGSQILFILEEIEYDKDPPTKSDSKDIADYTKKIADLVEKMTPSPKPRPWNTPARPYYPHYPPHEPVYPGYKPDIWCEASNYAVKPYSIWRAQFE